MICAPLSVGIRKMAMSISSRARAHTHTHTHIHTHTHSHRAQNISIEARMYNFGPQKKPVICGCWNTTFVHQTAHWNLKTAANKPNQVQFNYINGDPVKCYKGTPSCFVQNASIQYAAVRGSGKVKLTAFITSSGVLLNFT